MKNIMWDKKRSLDIKGSLRRGLNESMYEKLRVHRDEPIQIVMFNVPKTISEQIKLNLSEKVSPGRPMLSKKEK